MNTFNGIPREGFAFLLDLRFHNERPWFQANKQVYIEQVKKPTYALAAALAPTALAIDPEIEVRPERVVSRIYRDARRVRGGNFYRDVVWLSFKRTQGAEYNPFSYYVYFDPESYGWGCGFWDPRPMVMEQLRRRIDARPDSFHAIAADPVLQKYTVNGDHYKRPKKITGDALVDDWYNRKTLSVDMDMPVDAGAFAPDLLDRVRASMLELAPLYRFVLGIEE